MGDDLVSSCPDVMSDEENARVWKRVMEEVEREAGRPGRGDSLAPARCHQDPQG
jgi:hypothetical protein